MATYYCDSAGSNTSPYDTWAKAATALQTVLDLAVAGEIIYFRGTQTMAATLNVNTNSGTNAAGWIKLIGCNASGNVDGTRAVIDANGGSYHAVTWAGMDLCWWENIEVTNTAAGSYDGINMTSSSWGCVFINCSFHNCGRHGVVPNNYDSNSLWYRCAFYSNGGNGFNYGSANSRRMYCSFHDNTGDGLGLDVGINIGCLVYDNGDDGIDMQNYPHGTYYNCVIDSNADDGIYQAASIQLLAPLIFGCRITNHSATAQIGLNTNSEPVLYGYNVFDNNGDNVLADIAQFIPIENTTTDSNEYYSENTQEAEGTLQGYTSDSDYNLTSTADLRRDKITVPLT